MSAPISFAAERRQRLGSERLCRGCGWPTNEPLFCSIRCKLDHKNPHEGRVRRLAVSYGYRFDKSRRGLYTLVDVNTSVAAIGPTTLDDIEEWLR